MTALTPTQYARLRRLPVSTITDAIRAGLIERLWNGRIDAEATDAGWLADHLARAARVATTEASRTKRRDAAAVAAVSAIHSLRRQIAELERTTVTRAAAEAAHQRRLERLQAALQDFPARYTPDAATALQRPEAAVRQVLQTFTARLIAELAMPAEPGNGADGKS